jgi:starch-binding outer membrane protein, SusD/RagB family
MIEQRKLSDYQVRNIGIQIYTFAPNSNYYALPLPDDIIRITGMKQNA